MIALLHPRTCRLPLGTALLHAHHSPAILPHRHHLHAMAPLRQEETSRPSMKVSQEVLQDKSEPGWAMSHSRYTEEGELYFGVREGVMLGFRGGQAF